MQLVYILNFLLLKNKLRFSEWKVMNKKDYLLFKFKKIKLEFNTAIVKMLIYALRKLTYLKLIQNFHAKMLLTIKSIKLMIKIIIAFNLKMKADIEANSLDKNSVFKNPKIIKTILSKIYKSF